MTDSPQIDIVLVNSTEKPGGIGEPVVALMAPAIANAVAKLNGKRVRSLPITADAIKSAWEIGLSLLVNWISIELTGKRQVPVPTALILASGRGERFFASGGQTHKLKALLSGKPVLQHVIDAVKASGLPYHVEDVGHPGMGDSVAAAVRATPNACGWLILPGDLPLIQAVTLQRLADKLMEPLAAHQVVVPVYQGQRGHPVGFARACGDALQALQGPQGAAAVVRRFVVAEVAVSDIGCVTDIDTLEALQAAQALADARQ
jgi:molybdenum cofactor cytidylyltransferase